MACGRPPKARLPVGRPRNRVPRQTSAASESCRQAPAAACFRGLGPFLVFVVVPLVLVLLSFLPPSFPPSSPSPAHFWGGIYWARQGFGVLVRSRFSRRRFRGSRCCCSCCSPVFPVVRPFVPPAVLGRQALEQEAARLLLGSAKEVFKGGLTLIWWSFLKRFGRAAIFGWYHGRVPFATVAKSLGIGELPAKIYTGDTSVFLERQSGARII